MRDVKGNYLSQAECEALYEELQRESNKVTHIYRTHKAQRKECDQRYGEHLEAIQEECKALGQTIYANREAQVLAKARDTFDSILDEEDQNSFKEDDQNP